MDSAWASQSFLSHRPARRNHPRTWALALALALGSERVLCERSARASVQMLVTALVPVLAKESVTLATYRALP